MLSGNYRTLYTLRDSTTAAFCFNFGYIPVTFRDHCGDCGLKIDNTNDAAISNICQ